MPMFMVTCSSDKLNAQQSKSTFKIPARNSPKLHESVHVSIDRVISSEIFRTCTDYVHSDPLIRKSQLIRMIERTLQKNGAKAERVPKPKANLANSRATIASVGAPNQSGLPVVDPSPQAGTSQQTSSSQQPGHAQNAGPETVNRMCEAIPNAKAIPSAKERMKFELNLTKNHSLVDFNNMLQLRISNLEQRLVETMERVSNVYSDITKITDPRSAQRALNFCKQLQQEIKKLSQVRKHFMQYFKRHETRKRIEEEIAQKLKVQMEDDETTDEQRPMAQVQPNAAKEMTPQCELVPVSAPKHRSLDHSEKSLCDMKLEQLRGMLAARQKLKDKCEAKTRATSPAKESESPSSSTVTPLKPVQIKSIPSQSSKIHPTPDLVPEDYDEIHEFRYVDMHQFPREFVEEVRRDHLSRTEMDMDWFVPPYAPKKTTIRVKKPYRVIYGSPMSRDVQPSLSRKTEPPSYHFRTLTDALTAEIRADAEKRERKRDAALRKATMLNVNDESLSQSMTWPGESFSQLSVSQQHPELSEDTRWFKEAKAMAKTKTKHRKRSSRHSNKVDQASPQADEKRDDKALGLPAANCIKSDSRARHLAGLSGEFCLFRMKYFNRLCYKRSQISDSLNTREGYCTYPDIPQDLDFVLMPKVRRKSFAEFLVLTPEHKKVHNSVDATKASR